MAADLDNSYYELPQSLWVKLIEFEQAHHLSSIAQAAVTALAEFFDIDLNSSPPEQGNQCNRSGYFQVDKVNGKTVFTLPGIETVPRPSSPNAIVELTGLIARISKLETTVAELRKQILALDQKYPTMSPSATGIPDPPALCLSASAQQQGGVYSTTSNPSHSPQPLHSSQATDLIQSSRSLSPLDWKRGLTTGELAVRLKTNPSTLKKYLRDLKQIQWAVDRDPEEIGWVYDPLLLCYYPIRADAQAQLPQSESPVEKPSEQQLSQESLLAPTPASLDLQGGLTQSQLSRLINIPINTLQRWKELPDCAKRIRCRTEGRFSYCYLEQNRRFYPITDQLLH